MKKANHQTNRSEISDFRQIINVGPATASDFERLGIRRPQELIGRDPWELYESMCRIQQQRLDPCVLDVFISVVDYMNGNRPKAWWKYTAKRKKEYGNRVPSV